eukprot:SAG11_NODE_33087_length_279_cov_0.588889_1_plen_57_part_01
MLWIAQCARAASLRQWAQRSACRASLVGTQLPQRMLVRMTALHVFQANLQQQVEQCS